MVLDIPVNWHFSKAILITMEMHFEMHELELKRLIIHAKNASSLRDLWKLCRNEFAGPIEVEIKWIN